MENVLRLPDIRDILRGSQNPEAAEEVTCQDANDDLQKDFPDDGNRDEEQADLAIV